MLLTGVDAVDAVVTVDLLTVLTGVDAVVTVELLRVDANAVVRNDTNRVVVTVDRVYAVAELTVLSTVGCLRY